MWRARYVVSIELRGGDDTIETNNIELYVYLKFFAPRAKWIEIKEIIAERAKAMEIRSISCRWMREIYFCDTCFFFPIFSTNLIYLTHSVIKYFWIKMHRSVIVGLFQEMKQQFVLCYFIYVRRISILSWNIFGE